MILTAEARPGVLRRLWIYQAERFPLGKTGALLAVFTASGLSLSAHLEGRALPHPWTFVAVWLVAVVFLFHLRVADEFKDFDDDRRHRPERAVPRGLVSLRLLLGLAVAAGLVAIGLTLSVSPALLGPLLLVWLWLGLMTAEFFAPSWLKARPMLYLVSHMAIMAFIDFYVTAAEWLPHGPLPPTGIWVFIALSCVNGCVLEFGRKTWAPQNERPGVETYSALYGPARAAMMWAAACVLSFVLLGVILRLLGAPWLVWGVGAVVLIAVLVVAVTFARRPSPAGQKRLDLAAGLFVFACYALAGLAGPLS